MTDETNAKRDTVDELNDKTESWAGAETLPATDNDLSLVRDVLKEAHAKIDSIKNYGMRMVNFEVRGSIVESLVMKIDELRASAAQDAKRIDAMTMALEEEGEIIINLKDELELSYTNAAARHASADAYAGLLAEGQLGKQLIAWADDDDNWISDGNEDYCIFCHSDAVYVDEPKMEDSHWVVTHAPNCLHLACRDYLATATATATGAEGETK